MRLALVALLFVTCGLVNAYQTLDSGYFLYYNVTAGANSSVFAGVDTSSNINLIVINASDLAAWSSSGNVGSAYKQNVGSGVYKIPVSPGKYSVLFDAISNVQITAGAVAFPDSQGRIIGFSGPYSYNISVSNYSATNITILTDRDFQSYPIFVNLSSQYTQLVGDGNLEFLNFNLTRGTYTLHLDSQFPTEVFVGISYSPSLVDPLSQLSSPYSVGVASYGVYNKSGTLIPYQISTGGVVGVANITSLSAYSENTSGNVSQYGASLQLNVELNTHADGQLRVFWLQNVVDFNTSADDFYLVDNIWNSTLPDANMSNSSLRGMGNVTVCGGCGNQAFYAYSYPSGYFNYSLPLNIKLVMLENQTANGTVLSFGYQLLQNGSGGVQPLVFYDRVLLPGYTNSTVLVTPFYLTPSQGNFTGNYYDAEFVFGGESNGAESIFNSLRSMMWIYYYKGGSLVPFPSAYTFGSDTQESAGNVRVFPYAYGGIAATGNPDPSEQLVVGNGIDSYAAYVSNTSKYTSYPTTTIPGLIASVPGIGAVSNYTITQYVIYALIALAVLAVIRLLVRRL